MNPNSPHVLARFTVIHELFPRISRGYKTRAVRMAVSFEYRINGHLYTALDHLPLTPGEPGLTHSTCCLVASCTVRYRIGTMVESREFEDKSGL